MLARQCDRCNKLYDQKLKYPKANSLRLIRLSQTASRYQKTIDLCPECIESLTRWFEEIEND